MQGNITITNAYLFFETNVGVEMVVKNKEIHTKLDKALRLDPCIARARRGGGDPLRKTIHHHSHPHHHPHHLPTL